MSTALELVPTLHKPLHSKVSNYLNNQRRSGQYCDLIIELELDTATDDGIAEFGHFCVVGAQSRFIGGPQFIQKSLQFSIHNPLKVTINNFSCTRCLHTMMEFFYEDVVSIAKEHEPHFKQLAKILAVTELMKLFEMPEDPITTADASGEKILKQECDHSTDLVVDVDVDNSTVRPAAGMEGDINLGNKDIFNDQRNFFKLRNPRASNSSSKINYCIGCDFKCYRVQEMITHMSSCEPSHLTCSLCEVGFLAWREYEAHIKQHVTNMKKPFFCLECGARFVNRAALTIHLPKHTTETPHQCQHCGKGFKWKQGLNNHMIVHNKEKQMLCDVCGYSTTHMKALKSHKLQHTGEYFKCPYPDCKHHANRKENLRLHMETHKQERPFVCEVCGCKFSQNKNLKRHALKHSTDEIHKYKCQLCSFSSHRSDKLKEHVQRVHTEKEVQLELPEIVENAFENNVCDEFDLPPLSMVDMRGEVSVKNEATANSEATKKVHKRKKAAILAQKRRMIPIAPKPEADADENLN
ncbi:zinc finger and BTB domain-containing protein 24 [Anastrepha ludens]|uniref:zinc finger and BTB domain-containing protein 24 n=1 Tax=Anastrepha ludens TaxID=28586 RepID=UPI0023AF91E3|nr:zinc finger and BTB domain-containing protein 24 [Anastrepha ludens]